MAPSTPAVPAKRALPSKESSLFKDLLSHYESRQLKKGQKAADQILKKFPEHGGTVHRIAFLLEICLTTVPRNIKHEGSRPYPYG